MSNNKIHTSQSNVLIQLFVFSTCFENHVFTRKTICTKVAQTVMPHIYFSRELFIQNVWNARAVWLDVSFSHVIFPHNLRLCLHPYASANQGHACLPFTSSSPVHVVMSSLHESRPRSCSSVSPLSEALTLWTQRPTVLLSTAQLPYTAHKRLWIFPTLSFSATKNSITAHRL